ncbi:hypothetical protein BH11PSE11_BH11PSE11_03690 [soil metagenome]
MRKVIITLCLVPAFVFANENTANLTNSSATQVSSGSGNKQSVSAVNSTASQTQSGIGNQQSMTLNNANGKQIQSGAGNSQSMTLHPGQSATQIQDGIGNKFTVKLPCGAAARNITARQTGMFNDQTVSFGNVAGKEKDCVKQPATSTISDK